MILSPRIEAARDTITSMWLTHTSPEIAKALGPPWQAPYVRIAARRLGLPFKNERAGAPVPANPVRPVLVRPPKPPKPPKAEKPRKLLPKVAWYRPMESALNTFMDRSRSSLGVVEKVAAKRAKVRLCAGRDYIGDGKSTKCDCRSLPGEMWCERHLIEAQQLRESA